MRHAQPRCQRRPRLCRVKSAHGADAVGAVETALADIAGRVAAGTVPLDAFVIHRAVSKPPADYADAASLPHVQMALRRQAAGRPVVAGDIVPYVVTLLGLPAPGDGPDAAGPAAAAASDTSPPPP